MQNREKGFTLVEVLAAIVILAIAGLGMLAFFTNALSYTKGNQNKTVAVNLARHVLVYMGSQNFDLFKTYFSDSNHYMITKKDVHANVTITNQNDPSTTQEVSLFTDPDSAYQVFTPKVNGIEYEVTVRYQDERVKQLSEDPEKKGLVNLLIPIEVEVKSGSSNRNHSIVEGYIVDEKIR